MVNLRINHVRRSSAKSMKKKIESPNVVPLGRVQLINVTSPKFLKASGRSPMLKDLVPRNTVIAPWNKLAVPSVTIRTGILKTETKTALIAPSPIPIEQARAKAAKILSIPVATRICVVMYWAQMATAVKDTSTPPESITINTPMARIAIGAEALVIIAKLFSVKKTGLNVESTIQKASSTRAR